MNTQLCIFEDIFHTRLLPLVYFRPTFNLRCGVLSLKEKIQFAYPKAEVVLHTRSYLADYMRIRNVGFKVNDISSKKVLFVNGRVIVDRDFAKKIPLEVDEDVV
jgi:hypothetical protein